MEKLVQRIRGVMHLLLLWSLVLLWVASVDPIDLTRLTWDLERNWHQLNEAFRERAPLAQDSFRQLRAEFARLHRPLNPLWHASLKGDGAVGSEVTADRYLRQCDQVLAKAREMIAAEFTDSANIEGQKISNLLGRIERQIELLRWHAKPELGPTATLADVARAARPQIAIPGSGQSVPMAIGVAMSIVGLTCVYLYLASLHRALRQAMGRDAAEQVDDWVFMHPGWLGPALGFCWLTLPLISLVVAGNTIFTSQAVNSVGQLPQYCAPLLPAAWLWCCASALRTRQTGVSGQAAAQVEEADSVAPTFDFRQPVRRRSA